MNISDLKGYIARLPHLKDINWEAECNYIIQSLNGVDDAHTAECQQLLKAEEARHKRNQAYRDAEHKKMLAEKMEVIDDYADQLLKMDEVLEDTRVRLTNATDQLAQPSDRNPPFRLGDVVTIENVNYPSLKEVHLKIDSIVMPNHLYKEWRFQVTAMDEKGRAATGTNWPEQNFKLVSGPEPQAPQKEEPK